MTPRSLQAVLDNFFGYPKEYYVNGKLRFKTSIGMINKGNVEVNNRKVSDGSFPLHSGDFVKFGMKRYKEYFIVP